MNGWRERHDDAVQRQHDTYRAYRQATLDRAEALEAGSAELGSQAAVARELGVSRAVVNRAIRARDKLQHEDQTPA